ncbi:hypothetical protein HGRIS_002309 [Hohenbuehelia grisea]
MIASPGDDDDDDDAWVSTESGAATPSNDSDNESGELDNDTAAEAARRSVGMTTAETPVDRSRVQRPPPRADRDSEREVELDRYRNRSALQLQQIQDQAMNGQYTAIDHSNELARIDTARPNDYPDLTVRTPTAAAPPPHQEQTQAYTPADQRSSHRSHETRQLPPLQTQLPAQSSGRARTPEPVSAPPLDTVPSLRSPTLPSARSHKRLSATRPPSLISNASRTDHGHGHQLRPHPLIRGQSYGQPYVPVSKPAPLEPLTVISAPTPPHSQSAPGTPPMSTSPTSMKTTSASPSSPQPAFSRTPNTHLRRTSVSSARSVATVPGMPTASATISQPRTANDRHRTLSSLSALNMSASSAALSSLAGHHPHLHHQHPASAHAPLTPPTVVFFPPQNPHVNLDTVHPLLPRPYLHSHMTVLTRRDPFRESCERVMRAKQGLNGKA